MDKRDFHTQLLLADIDELLSARHADTLQVLTCGARLIQAATRQIIADAPHADHPRLRQGIRQQVLDIIDDTAQPPPLGTA